MPLGGDAFVAEAQLLEAAEFVFGDGLGGGLRDGALGKRDLTQLVQEPGVHLGEPRNLAHAHAALEGEAQVAETARTRGDEHLRQTARIEHLGAGFFAGFECAPGLHQRFLEGAADGHDLAD